MIQNPSYGYMPQYQQPMMYQQNNPYLERINNLQQYQQTLQQPQQTQVPMLNGKIVDSVDVVKATDIPMSGNVFYFPKADGTEVYAKQWLANGTTQIVTYKPVFDTDDKMSTESDKMDSDAFNAFTDDIMKRFDDLESKIEELKKPTTQKPVSRTKKESDVE